MFIPTFILNEPVRSLFMPLTLAVGFSMIASYLLSSTLVPVLSVWLVRHGGKGEHEEGIFDRLHADFVSGRGDHGAASLERGFGLPGRVRRSFGWWGETWARNCFPTWIPASSCCVLRAPGSEYELTRKCANQDSGSHRRKSHGNLAMSIGYVGMGSTNTATNNILLFMRASDDGLLRVRLRKDSGVAVDKLRERLCRALPAVVPWLEKVLRRQGCSHEEAVPRRVRFRSVSSRATSSAP